MSDRNAYTKLFAFDRSLRELHSVICGVDEAGRGPLAGDVYAAAVILRKDMVIEGLNDSKKVSEKQREKLFDVITRNAKAYCIATASVEEIDSLNILQATMLAMQRAVAGIKIRPDIVLIDGNRIPELDCASKCIVKGDSVSASIAAASILAKVSRDRYMKQIAEKYPQYGFERHKGYGTKLHYEALAEYGPCEIHRKTFLKNLNYDKK